MECESVPGIFIISLGFGVNLAVLLVILPFRVLSGNGRGLFAATRRGTREAGKAEFRVIPADLKGFDEKLASDSMILSSELPFQCEYRDKRGPKM